MKSSDKVFWYRVYTRLGRYVGRVSGSDYKDILERAMMMTDDPVIKPLTR